jgi:hypothetical protein
VDICRLASDPCPHHDTSCTSSTYPESGAYLHGRSWQKHAMNRSYLGSQSLDGCPVGGVRGRAHLVEHGKMS